MVLELVEHLVQAERDRSELVEPRHRCSRTQVAGPRPPHRLTDLTERAVNHAPRREIDHERAEEDRDQRESGAKEPAARPELRHGSERDGDDDRTNTTALAFERYRDAGQERSFLAPERLGLLGSTPRKFDLFGVISR